MGSPFRIGVASRVLLLIAVTQALLHVDVTVAYPSKLSVLKNFMSYGEEPLLELIREKLENGDLDDMGSSDLFMDKSRFRIHHDPNWPPEPLAIRPLGQISGVDTDLKGNPVIFHRAESSWSSQAKPPAIKGNTIAVIDRDSGKILSEWGNNTFHVPHGITIDHRGNVWVTDTGTHQVMKFPPGATKPSLVLGEKFVSGKDAKHFCRPTDVAVATNGAFFVSDGYCNSRIVKFDPQGNFVRQYKNGDMKIVHDLTLIEERDAICAADRENGRIICFPAGLRGDLIDLAKPIAILPEQEQLGAIYAISNLGPTIIGVRQPGRNNNQRANGIVLSFDKGNVIDTWQRQPKEDQDDKKVELVTPHDVVVSKDGKTVYVAEIGPNRLSKFNVEH